MTSFSIKAEDGILNVSDSKRMLPGIKHDGIVLLREVGR
jgi:hypothetical protein